MLRRWIDAHTFAPRGRATRACTSSMRTPPGSATSIPFSSPVSLTANGPTRRAGTSSIRRACCATSDGRRGRPARRRSLGVPRSAAAALVAAGRLVLHARERRGGGRLDAARRDRRGRASTTPRSGIPARHGSSSTKRSGSSRSIRRFARPAGAAGGRAADEPRRRRRTGDTHGARHGRVFAERARALPGLPVQVLRGRRAAARGTAGRRADAVAAGARPLHPRGVSALLRGVGRARPRHDHRRTASTRRAGCSRTSRRRCSRASPRRKRCSSARGCSVRPSRSASSTSSSASRRRGRATVRERWLEYRFDGEFSLGANGGSADPDQRRRRSHRSARRQSPARHRLQVRHPRRSRSGRCRRRSTRYVPRNGWRSATGSRGPSTKPRTSHSPVSARWCRWSGRTPPMPPPFSPPRAPASWRSSTAIGRGEFPARPHDLRICRLLRLLRPSAGRTTSG